MTTILLGRPENNGGQWAVFGKYEGEDDRYTFGVRYFDDCEPAEEYARRMMELHDADEFVQL